MNFEEHLKTVSNNVKNTTGLTRELRTLNQDHLC